MKHGLEGGGPRQESKERSEHHIELKHFAVRFHDAHGREVENDAGTFSVEFSRYQDVLDVVPYVLEEGQPLRMAVSRSYRPAVDERAKLPGLAQGLDAPGDSSRMDEAFGGYIRQEEGEASMDASAARILDRKFPGARMKGELETLGGCYFPSVGTATELVYPRAVRIENADALPEDVELKTPQEIVDGYLSGTYFSTRLVELAFRLARSKRQPLAASEHPLKDAPRVDVRSFADKRISIGEARALISTLDATAAPITHVSVEETAAPARPFLSAISAPVTLPSGKQETFEFVARRGVDSVDVGCFVPTDEGIFIPIKCGVRPTLAVRNLAPHPVQTDTSPLFLEGVAGSLSGEERSVEEIERVAVSEIHEEIGMEPTAVSYIGYDYPSPGHNLERAYRFIAAVDPSKRIERPQTADETVGSWLIELNDLLDLVDEGVIRDPRLALNARLIAHLSGYPERERAQASAEAERAYDAIINHGSDIQAWLSETARDVDNKLSRSLYYRRLKSYCENELGIVALELAHPDEAGFFSAMVPVFSVPEGKEAHKMPFNFLHDLFHYATWGFVPLKRMREDGTPELHSFDEYFKAIGGNECHAVWYSDVVMPEEFGIEDTEAIFGGTSVAGAFRALGMDEEAARRGIRSIELDGTLPADILMHPDFERYRGVFVDRLLKFYVLDHENTKGVYEYWQQHPRVLAAAARFCNAFTDLEQYETHYLSLLEGIANYTEGLNPLRAHLSRVANVRIRLNAMRLAVLSEHLAERAPEDPRQEKIRVTLDALEDAYKEIGSLRASIEDVDRSPKHLAMLERLGGYEQGICADADALAAGIIEDAAIFLPEETKELSGRVLPFFEPFRVPNDEEIQARVAELERASRERAGV